MTITFFFLSVIASFFFFSVVIGCDGGSAAAAVGVVCVFVHLFASSNDDFLKKKCSLHAAFVCPSQTLTDPVHVFFLSFFLSSFLSFVATCNYYSIVTI